MPVSALFATGEHFLAAPYQMSNSFTLLSRLAADAGDMQVAATVILCLCITLWIGRKYRNIGRNNQRKVVLESD
ncbi:MAG: hypothetical protein CM1200mP22_33490 [Dehalococcoidia bacterium]|nr:MAG: hypothetical protein CM1200mP22_33490 [Dehalococcoidia bacterium]